MVAAAYPTNVPRHSTAIQMLSGGRKSPLWYPEATCLPVAVFFDWFHILLVYHPFLETPDPEATFEAGLGLAPLLGTRILECMVTEQLRMPVVGMGTK